MGDVIELRSRLPRSAPAYAPHQPDLGHLRLLCLGIVRRWSKKFTGDRRLPQAFRDEVASLLHSRVNDVTWVSISNHEEYWVVSFTTGVDVDLCSFSFRFQIPPQWLESSPTK